MARESNREKCIPLELTNALTKRYPGCWDNVEMLRQDRGVEVPDWDIDVCYIPIAGTIAITTNGEPGVDFLLNNPDRVADASLMAAIAPWRIYKQIFEFAPETERLLYAQADDCKIPIDVLRNLPYPSIYIVTKEIERMDGFFVHIEHDVNSGRMELRMTIVFDGGDTVFPMPIHLMEGGTLSDGIEEAQKESRRVLQEFNTNDIIRKKHEIFDTFFYEYAYGVLSPLMQLVLYICAQNKEVSVDERQEKIVRIPKSKDEIKDRYREVRKYNVGEQTARKIRGIYGNQNGVQFTYLKDDGFVGGTKRPHVRRGHWHHFWAGKAEDKRLILKWLPPTFIHPDTKSESDIQINEIQDVKRDNEEE